MDAGEPEANPGSKYLNREEWMLMFMAGVPVEKIARVCSVPRRTVYGHIWRRVKAEPWRRSRRLVIHDQPALPTRPVAKKQLTWQERWIELKSFQLTHRRLPSPNSNDAAEQHLISWVYGQRRKARRKELSKEQLKRLGEIPGWQRPPKAEVEEALWQLRLKETAMFQRKHRTWPKYEKTRPEHERVIAVWLGYQRLQLRRERLAPDRKAQLDQILPEWKTNSRSRR